MPATTRRSTRRPRPTTTPVPEVRAAAGRVPLTAQGHAILVERARRLREERLPELRPLLVERERDERDVAEFERSQAELDRLERLLAESAVLDHTGADPARVHLGARIVIETPDQHRETVRIVHPVEASLDDERIALTSPLAQAVLGARVGETVWVPAPIGAWPARVVEVLLDDAPGLRRPKKTLASAS